MLITIALGGNALGNDPITQKEKASITAKAIIPFIKAGHKVIITHGNGPQVGLINLAFDTSSKVNDKIYQMPFSECGAMSQGYIGYHLQNAINNELENQSIKKKAICVITQVEVSKDDKAFLNPTKPIGAFYTLEEAKKSKFIMKEDAGRGYRRVVPSPKPKKVLEEDCILSLANNGYIVITCGGGGIPVVKDHGKYVGVDAVIDKDFASSKLSSDINSDCLLILTAVDKVCLNYNKPDQITLDNITLEKAIEYNNQGHFLSGSMKPKIEACIEFLQNNSQGIAIITSIEKAFDALNGMSGTIIRCEK